MVAANGVLRYLAGSMVEVILTNLFVDWQREPVE